MCLCSLKLGWAAGGLFGLLPRRYFLCSLGGLDRRLGLFNRYRVAAVLAGSLPELSLEEARRAM